MESPFFYSNKSAIISIPGTVGANQSVNSFYNEFNKIKSNTIKKEIIFLFRNPDRLLGACLSCRYTGIMIVKPVLQVTMNKGGQSIFIKGECYHPDLPQCVGKISKLIAREKITKEKRK